MMSTRQRRDKIFRFCRIVVVLNVLAFLFSAYVFAQKAYSADKRIQALYDYHENVCTRKGWQKITAIVSGSVRKILWKGPKDTWQNGAIIVLHGGGGTYSNYCSDTKIGEPMVEFSELAIREGFAVFSLDSEDDLMLDERGNSCGKRWDCLALDSRPNIDLDFIKEVITEVIPGLRPQNSSEDIFMTGISNGGFMTILAATHLQANITAFAPVSAGDPYGTYMDCADRGTGRENAPGRWYDAETSLEICETDSCLSVGYIHEKPWVELLAGNRIFFKQFHHEGDAGVDISCMKKAQRLLSQSGYNDAGSYIIKNTGQKKPWKHFGQREYNKPLIAFFKRFSKQENKKYNLPLWKDYGKDQNNS